MHVIIVFTNRRLVGLHSLNYINYSFQNKFKKCTDINFLHIFREKNIFHCTIPFRLPYSVPITFTLSRITVWDSLKDQNLPTAIFFGLFLLSHIPVRKCSLGKINTRHLWANAILTEKGTEYKWSDVFLNGSLVVCCQGWFLFLCLRWPESTSPLARFPAYFSFKIPVRSLKKEGVLKSCGSDKN